MKLHEALNSLLEQSNQVENMLEKLPPSAKKWAESLPWEERRYLLSLCHLLCAASSEMQAEFLDQYTADGLITKIWKDKDTQAKVQSYLQNFRIYLELNHSVLRKYIRQFYIHSAQDVRFQSNDFLESALRLVISPEEQNNVLSYILGFEVIRIMFKMSWLEHERLYILQANQEEFYLNYIKPIQNAHKLNGIIVPSKERNFFAKRNHFVEKPKIKERKLIELVMVTFTTEMVNYLGLSILRHPKKFPFDYDFIYQPEEEYFEHSAAYA